MEFVIVILKNKKKPMKLHGRLLRFVFYKSRFPNTFPISRFDIGRIKHPSKILIICNDKKQKKQSIHNIITYMKNVQQVHNIVEDDHEYALEDQRHAYMICQRQRNIPKCMFVFGYNHDFSNMQFYSTFIKTVCMNSCHFNISNIFATPLICDGWRIPPYARSQMDYIFIFAEDDKEKRYDIWNMFGRNIIKDYNVWDQLFDVLTYNSDMCMVVRKRYNDIYWYRVSSVS